MCGEGRREHFDEQQKQKRFKITLIYGKYLRNTKINFINDNIPSKRMMGIFIFILLYIFQVRKVRIQQTQFD